MKKLQKFIFLFSMLMFLYQVGNTQNEDVRINSFNTWTSLKLEKKINSKFRITVNPQVRFKEKEWSSYFVETEARYKVNKLLSSYVGYRYRIKKKNKQGTKSTGRIYADVKVSKSIERFKPSFRIRFQNLKDYEDLDIENTLRSKLSTSYDIRKTKIEPQIAFELFYSLTNSTVPKTRYLIGSSYDLSKRQSFSLAYQLDYNYDDPENEHILVMKYNFKF